MTNHHIPNLFTPNQLVTRHHWLSMGRLRKWLFYRQSNGLAVAVIKLKKGSGLLIDEDKFIAWITQGGE